MPFECPEQDQTIPERYSDQVSTESTYPASGPDRDWAKADGSIAQQQENAPASQKANAASSY